MPFSLPHPEPERGRPGLHSSEGSLPVSPAPDRRAPELAALLGRMAQADEFALAEFYKATCRRVFGLVTSIVKERHGAEETTLDVYTQAWQQAGTFTPARGSALAWLLTIARSRAIDKARALRAGSERGGDRSSIEKLAAELFAPDPSPLATVMLAERSLSVRAAVAELPRGQREAIAAAYFRGLSHSEISATLDVPLGTIKTRIRAAMTSLAAALCGLAPEIQ